MIDASRLAHFEREVLARALSSFVVTCERQRRRARSERSRADMDWKIFVATTLLMEVAPDASRT